MSLGVGTHDPLGGELLGIRLVDPDTRDVEFVRKPFVEWVAEVAAAFREINRLLLGGSRARGDHRPDSDFDVLVELNPSFYTAVSDDDPPFVFDVMRDVPESRFARPPDCRPNIEVERRIAYDERVHSYRAQVDLTFVAPPPFRGQWKHWHTTTWRPICVNWDVWPAGAPRKVIYSRSEETCGSCDQYIEAIKADQT